MTATPEFVYVASSWSNALQQGVVHTLRAAGIGCYDFKHPPGGTGFGWEEVMRGYRPGGGEVVPSVFLDALSHPRAVEGFAADFAALQRSDAVVLVLPCGRSAHLELGWAVGAGKRTAILLAHPDQPMVPELMYRMVDHIAPTLFDLLGWMGVRD